MMEGGEAQSNKSHRARRGDKGRKASELKKKAVKRGELSAEDARQRNPRAFAIQKVGKAERRVRRKEDISEKRKHVPQVDRAPTEPPPAVVAIVGPPKVGKSTLLRALVRNFTRQALTDVRGPVTLVSGKRQRLTLVECSNDVNAMIDVAKVADLALVLVDASFGFEMEVFEFLNICQVHGFPRIMGVLTHLDSFKNAKTLQRTKKVMKHRFWTEVYQGAKLFYLSGMVRGEYQKTEVHNLGRFISVMKFRPLQWRESHPYLLADRMEDLTSPEDVRLNAKCDRRVSLYGYVRGTALKAQSSVHIPGCGDFPVRDVTFLPDPCPMPETVKKKRRTLQEKEKSIYAPMSGVGGIVYDKDAVYIELGGSHSHSAPAKKRTDEEDGSVKPSNELVKSMIGTESTLDEKMQVSEVRLFSGSAPIRQEDVEDGSGRIRRKAVFEGSGGDVDEVDSDDVEEDEEDSAEEEEGASEDEDSKEEASEAEDSKEEASEDEDSKEEEASEEEESDEDEGDSSKEDPDETEPSKKKIKTVGSMDRQLAKEMGLDEDASDSEESGFLEQTDSDDKRRLKTKNSKKIKSSSSVKPKQMVKENKTKSIIADALATIQEAKKTSHLAEESSSESSEEETDDGQSESDEDDVVEDSGDPEPMDDTSRNEEESETWKKERMKQASEAFYQRSSNPQSLRKLVYGSSADAARPEEDSEEETEEFEDLLRVVKTETEASSGRAAIMNQVDSTLFRSSAANSHFMQDWSLDEIKDSIRDCFVTGKWSGAEDAEALLKMDDEDDDVFGDFEDLETGEVHKGEEDKKTEGKSGK